MYSFAVACIYLPLIWVIRVAFITWAACINNIFNRIFILGGDNTWKVAHFGGIEHQ